MASHLPIKSQQYREQPPAIHQSHLPDGRDHPAYIANRTRTRTSKDVQHTAAHATLDVRSQHRTNPRSTHFVSGKASENRRRHRRYHGDPLSRGREVAHSVLRPSPKPEQPTFFAERRGIEIFLRLFSTYQPAIHLRSQYRVNLRSTRFVSGKASEYR